MVLNPGKLSACEPSTYRHFYPASQEGGGPRLGDN